MNINVMLSNITFSFLQFCSLLTLLLLLLDRIARTMYVDAVYCYQLSSMVYICARANTRLHYLKRLKLTGLPADLLTHWYISVIRPVLEYCAVVWHHGAKESYRVDWGNPETSSPRLSHYKTSMPYWAALHYAELPSLSDRCDKLCRDFFQKTRNPSSCIRHLLPPARDSDLTSRLRRASYTLDLATEPTVSNHSFTMLF